MTEENKKETKEVKMEDVRARAEEKKCPVQKSLVFVEEFLAGPMCGKCFPCSLGSYEARVILKSLTEGSGSIEGIDNIKKIALNMLETSRCKKGKDTAKFIIENTDLYEEHLSGICSHKECIDLTEYIIIPEQCTICGICQETCKYNAIIGEKKKTYLSGYLPFEIVQKRCTKCSECIKVCPYGAIEILSEPVEKETVVA